MKKTIERLLIVLVLAAVILLPVASAQYSGGGTAVFSTNLDGMTLDDLEDLIAAGPGGGGGACLCTTLVQVDESDSAATAAKGSRAWAMLDGIVPAAPGVYNCNLAYTMNEGPWGVDPNFPGGYDYAFTFSTAERIDADTIQLYGVGTLRTRIHKRLSSVWKWEILMTASAEAVVIS